MSSLTDILDAIVAGLATVTGLSSAAVAKYDYRVMNLPYSVVVTPAFAGEMRLQTADGSWTITHRINLLLTVSQRGDVQDLLNNTAAMVPRILAWFQAHDDLGLEDCLGCAIEPLAWTAPEEIGDNNGLLTKQVTFTVAPVLIA